jgi:hypothetical protein
LAALSGGFLLALAPPMPGQQLADPLDRMILEAREDIRAGERWRSIKVSEFEHRQITAVRKELDQEYEAQVGLKTQLSKDAAPLKYPGILGFLLSSDKGV